MEREFGKGMKAMERERVRARHAYKYYGESIFFLHRTLTLYTINYELKQGNVYKLTDMQIGFKSNKSSAMCS